MRTVSLAFTTVLAICIAMPAFAQSLPNEFECHELSRQRGAGEVGSGEETPSTHENFIRDCLAGKVTTTSPAIPEPVRQLRGMTYELCHELARQRGAGEVGSGRGRNHELFISACMAGRVSGRDAETIRTQTAPLRTRSEDACHQLALQRGAGEIGTGWRNHERFIRDCMAGRVS